MIASPLTWGLGIIFGMAAFALFPNPDTSVFDQLVRFLVSGPSSGSLILTAGLIALGAFVSMVVISTIDGTFISLCQIVESDILQCRKDRGFSHGQRACLMAGLFGLVLVFLVVHIWTGLDVLVYLSSFYALFLVVAPLTLVRLFAIRLPVTISILAIVLGAISGILAMSLSDIPYNIAIVLPMVTAIAVSALVVLIFLFFASRIRKSSYEFNKRTTIGTS